MSNPIPRALLLAICSCLLLLLGAALFLAGLYSAALALGAMEGANKSVAAVTVYYQVVVLKGLLPQLALTLGSSALVGWASGRDEALRGRLRALIELLGLSALAYAVVAPLLLTVEFAGWPALQMNSLRNQLTTFMLMTAISALCAWLPPTWLRSRLSGQPAPPGLPSP